jgi:hypothetical protein
MFFTQLLTVCACSLVVAAQGYGAPPPDTSPTTSAAPSIPSAPPSNSTQINVCQCRIPLVRLVTQYQTGRCLLPRQLCFQPPELHGPQRSVCYFLLPRVSSSSLIQEGDTEASHSGNIPHSVTQSSFADPCKLIASNGSNNGFDSGLQNGKQFTLQITDDSQRTYQQHRYVCPVSSLVNIH